MKELIEFLTDTEKKIIKILLGMVALSFIFLIFTLIWPRNQAAGVASKLDSQKRSFEQVKEARDKGERLWLQWSEASRQLEELKNNWFYRGENSLGQIRIDLEEIFYQARLSLPTLQYNYHNLEKSKIKKISLNLRLRTSYLSLRELLAKLEIFPKFLLIEDIDFQNVSEGGATLDLRLVVSAYYVY